MDHGKRLEESTMDWKDYLNEWGLSLRGLAQGGLHYGEDGEAG